MTLSARKYLFFIKKIVRHLMKSVSQLYKYLFLSLATPLISERIFRLSAYFPLPNADITLQIALYTVPSSSVSAALSCLRISIP